MATKYQTHISQHAKTYGTKSNLLFRKSKTDTMNDLNKMLSDAKNKLEQKMAEKDMVGADKIRKKIALLEATIRRQK